MRVYNNNARNDNNKKIFYISSGPALNLKENEDEEENGNSRKIPKINRRRKKPRTYRTVDLFSHYF